MAAHAVVDLRNTYGCAFIGLVISLMLFGITILQTWIYYWNYRNRDPTSLKLFVMALFLTDAFHTSLCIYSVYWYLILNFGNVESLGVNMWAINVQVDINTLVAFMVQLFYARRVYIVGKSIFVPSIITIFGTIHFALAFVFTTKATALKYFALYSSLIPITCIGMAAAVAADLLIASSMCWFLYHKRTGFIKTDSMIMTLMTYSINSGLLTSLFAIAVLITFTVETNTLIWEIFFWPMGKCYANSFLAMLNSRDYVRDRSTDKAADNAFDLSSLRIDQRSEVEKSKQTAVAVTVHHTATTDSGYAKRKLGGDLESATVDFRRSEASLETSVIPSQIRDRKELNV